ncbi:YtxH domain-containing protein [Crocosphaera sp. UHCC 0190]|uniref:YtxH domain-containing protein n=1 Tax=Crocosphaera sp. UHCC 0190 TaxID=3110246 RepID=UPI002B218D6A|nr:YtxH domain-containing protein [Crocosphaera sp. UHCC 0190]MEA5512187.1 YtxH domain-containing protein [Crocosphaera sp. UHCC 0190]
MSKNNNGGLFVVGMVIGGLLGTVTGILMAPRSGRETRRIIKKSADALPEMAEDLSTTVQLQADRLSESAQKNWGETLVRLKEAIAAGIEATQTEIPETSLPRDITSDVSPSDNNP